MIENHSKTRHAIILICIAICGLQVSISAANAQAVSGPAESAKERLLQICEDEEYAFTSSVRKAFLFYAKKQAIADLKTKGKSVPEEFMAWVDSDPEVEASVYCAHNKPADILLWLYSLRLDLGKAKFEKYRQLALAAAIVSVKQAVEADLSPREPLSLVIGSDPRKRVDTNEPGRELDINDHIINFLNDGSIEEEVVTGYKGSDDEIKYDDRGIAIPIPDKEPIIEKRKRSLYASDVLASRELQVRFNAYMKSKGHDVQIDCGDRVVHWNSCDAVHGEQRQKITAAYKLFRTAYEAKGYLPAARDSIPSPAERCLYIIRNYEHEFPMETQADRQWPLFPITAPWPVMTLLVDDNQPLREREERWIAFRDQGEFKKYGEYIGAIAQQFDIQSARRLKPYPYIYHTIQMMLKDGGVCGTMGSIGARSCISLGIPACQAIQPGHCAMVAFRYDAERSIYLCKGGQYATGGDEHTTPFARWYFGDEAKFYARRPGFGVQPNPRKPMVYHQSVAWSVNHGMSAFLDSTIAYNVYLHLDESDRKGRGRGLLSSGLAICPCNFLLADAAQASADTPAKQLQFWRTFQASLQAAGDKSGCVPDGLYSRTVRKKVFESIAKMNVPEDMRLVKEIFHFLQVEQCDVPAAVLKYRLAIDGLAKLLHSVEVDFQNHLDSIRIKATPENDAACARMVSALRTAATFIEDKEERTRWALSLWKQAEGREKYFGRWMRVATDPSVSFLAREAGQQMPGDVQMMQSLLDLLLMELKDSIAGKRDIHHCRQLAEKIKAAARHTKDLNQRSRWAADLSKIIAGHETFNPKENGNSLRDPCAIVIAELIVTN